MRAHHQALRDLLHDIKYAGLTLSNLPSGAPFPTWAYDFVYRDLFETRQNKSMRQLCEDCFTTVQDTEYADILHRLIEAASVFEEYRNALQQQSFVDLQTMQQSWDVVRDCMQELIAMLAKT
jgi:hypothetical protein